MIPGRALHRLAKFSCSPKVHEQIVEPQLADFQHEWARAANGRDRVLILLRGYGAFWCAISLSGIRGVQNEILVMTWRDLFPFPLFFLIFLLLFGMSESWVLTGSPWGSRWTLGRLHSMDSRWLFALVPIALVERFWGLSGAGKVGVRIAVLAVSTFVILRFDPLIGWLPSLVAIVVLTLIQPKKAVVRRREE